MASPVEAEEMLGWALEAFTGARTPERAAAVHVPARGESLLVRYRGE